MIVPRNHEAPSPRHTPRARPSETRLRGWAERNQTPFQTVPVISALVRALLAVLVSCLAVPAAADAAPGESQVDVTWNAGSNRSISPGLVLTYHFGEQAELHFSNQDAHRAAAVRRRTWRNLTPQCAELVDNALRRLNAGCRSARFALDLSTVRLDRVYPGVVALGHNGVVLYSGYLWHEHARFLRVRGPRGYAAALNGAARRLPATIAVDEASAQFVALAPSAALRSSGEPVVLISPSIATGLSAAARALVREQWRTISAAYGTSHERPPLVVLHQDPQEPGGAFHGDVTPGRVVRLSFFGRDWLRPRLIDNQKERIAAFVAHEFVHLVQQGMHEVQPWVSEGNAEFLSLSALMSTGHLPLDAASDRVRGALSNCLIAAIGRDWPDFFDSIQSGSAPYGCGLALHLAAAASIPEPQRRAYWAQAFVTGQRQPDPRYFGFLEAGRAVPPPYQYLIDAFASLDAKATPPSPEDEVRFGSSLLKEFALSLMQRDCEGQYGLLTGSTAIKTDAIPQCKQMSDLDIRTIEGIGVANAWAAAQAGSRACREKGRVMLGTAAAATEALAVSCVATWPDTLWVFDGSVARSIASGLLASPRQQAVEKRSHP